MRRPKLTLPSPLLLVLATAQAMLLLVTAWRTGPGWDEWGHLPSGLYTLQFCDHHPYQVNPPLIRVIAAVPVAAMGGAIEHQVLSTAPGFRSEGLLGMAYIHQQGEDVFYWLFRRICGFKLSCNQRKETFLRCFLGPARHQKAMIGFVVLF